MHHHDKVEKRRNGVGVVNGLINTRGTGGKVSGWQPNLPHTRAVSGSLRPRPCIYFLPLCVTMECEKLTERPIKHACCVRIIAKPVANQRIFVKKRLK